MWTRPSLHPWLAAALLLGGASPRVHSSPKPRIPLGDSRYPGEAPRPTGAWLMPVPEGVTLQDEAIQIRCDARGLGCRLRQRFGLRAPGLRAIRLGLLSPTVPRVWWNGRRVALEDGPEEASGPLRPVHATGRGVHPDTHRLVPLPGPRRTRALRRFAVRVSLPPQGRGDLVLETASVGGFDRTSRPRTQPEVSYGLHRRRDPFTYHHEVRLLVPGGRPRPGGGAGGVQVAISVPARLTVATFPPLRCARRRSHIRCTGRLPADTTVLHVSLTERHRVPLGALLTAGVAGTRAGAEAWLRAGLALLLRSRKDVLALAAETDAHRRFSLSLAYQLFLPYAPSTHEMGGHAELGVVLDAAPRVRAALRLGAAFHMSLFRLNLLADLYPDALRGAAGPGWRVLVGAGLGL